MVVYYIGEKQRGKKFLPEKHDKVIAALVVILAIVSLALHFTGIKPII